MSRGLRRRIATPFGVAVAVAVLTADLAGALAGQASRPRAAPESIESLAWLAGDWTGAMGRAAIEEHWIAPRAGTMLAVARTTAGDRTVAFEFLRIEQRPDGLVYVAQPGGRPPTEFRLTVRDGESATFENPQHDHPKIIRYRRQGNTLVAEIEGDEQGRRVKQSFTFTRR